MIQDFAHLVLLYKFQKSHIKTAGVVKYYLFMAYSGMNMSLLHKYEKMAKKQTFLAGQVAQSEACQTGNQEIMVL